MSERFGRLGFGGSGKADACVAAAGFSEGGGALATSGLLVCSSSNGASFISSSVVARGVVALAGRAPPGFAGRPVDSPAVLLIDAAKRRKTSLPMPPDPSLPLFLPLSPTDRTRSASHSLSRSATSEAV